MSEWRLKDVGPLSSEIVRLERGPAVVESGLSVEITIVSGRSRRRAVVLGAAAIAGLAGALFLAFKIESSLAAASAARAAITAGRHRQAREPLLRWLRAEPGSALAHALLAQVALEDGDLGKVTEELNQARALGYPKRGLERLHWAGAVLASDPNHAATNALMADYYSKRPNEAGLANFYRLRARPVQPAPP